MIYLEKYKRYVDELGNVYRYDSLKKEIIKCKLSNGPKGYLIVGTANNNHARVHRMIAEAFLGEIPNGYQVDHINRIRTDNRIENIRIVTTFENQRNRSNNCEFGKKYIAHYGYSATENIKQYKREYIWYKRHKNKCRWEKLEEK